MLPFAITTATTSTTTTTSSTASSAHHHSTTTTFAAQLYCAGAEEQRCPDSSQAGLCYWFKANLEPVRLADFNKSWEEQVRRFPHDRWDPLRAGIAGFRYFGPEEARECVKGKRIHLAGDSTTRDTFYEFASVAGHPLFTDRSLGAWAPGQYEPRAPVSSGGRDRNGECLGQFDRKKFCLRDERHPNPSPTPETRLSFQFLMRSNSSWEVGHASTILNAAERPLDAAFVQCPIYEWFKPDAYDYSKSKEERGRLVDVDELAVGPRHFDALGTSCNEYIDTVVRPAFGGGKGGGQKVFLLGPTPLPMWTRIHGTEQVESRVFESIHRGLGIRCHKHADDGAWSLSSRNGITPIDRYAIVGRRRRDAIHPFFNAQFAIVQMMLNSLCPAAHGGGGGRGPGTAGAHARAAGMGHKSR